MTQIVLDCAPDVVKITSGLEVSDPEGAGVLITSLGGGDMRVKCNGGSWQGGLQIFDAPNSTPNDIESGSGNLMASFSSLGVSVFGAPESLQLERVGQLAPTATLAEVIAKVNALELVLHTFGWTK